MDELEQKRILSRFCEIAAIEPITAIEYLQYKSDRREVEGWAPAFIGSGCKTDPEQMIKVSGQFLDRQIEELRDPAGR